MELRNQGFVRVRAAAVAVALVLAAALPTATYSPDAEARCCWRGGWFVGGAIVGAAIARPYYYYPYPAYVYPAPAYYAPAPVYYAPNVVYANPPVITQPAPGIERLASTPAPAAPAAAASPAATAAAAPHSETGLSLEDRLRRLQSACDQHLLNNSECQAKRQELLKLM